jgi:type VI secretion system protein ImpE
MTALLPPTSAFNDSPSLVMRLADAEAKVRSQPAQVAHRWELFQLLCVLGQWERAIQQLQVCARQQPDQVATAHACRDLIRAEKWRRNVFKGNRTPGFLFEPQPWVQGLVEALELTARGEIESADRVREAALDQATTVSARFCETHADWIGDSDSRLGPICEIITSRQYRWLPIAEIAAWKIERPATLLELIWAPCKLALRDGSAVLGFMPARYPALPEDDDALRLGGRTEWRETGRTAVIGMGRKTWTTSAGDFSVFELASCEFGDQNPDQRLGVADAYE